MNHATTPDAGSLESSIQDHDGMPVFERLGIIVRALHDTLTEIGAQDVLADAAREFPSARERLLHIADLTENAANIVLTKVEQNTPLLDQLASQASVLERNWADGAPDAQLIAGTRAFLVDVQHGCGTTRSALSDIMMAQDFQDLTGQLIKKVVVLMERTENDLLKLLIDAAPPGAVIKMDREEIMAGPGAPGHIALDQENVDDLLADLGF
jgi:chemotaxis protein CheZ